MTWFSSIFRSRHQQAQQGRRRLSLAKWPALVYAIGDVHGCIDELRTLERLIAQDAAAATVPQTGLIVLLGDYVDRGPASASVLEHLLSPPPAGLERMALAGNHEQLMLDFLAHPDLGHRWLELGGRETLASYGVDVERMLSLARSPRQLREYLVSYVPEQHLQLLRSLPVCFGLPGTIFVHAGLRAGLPLDKQTDQDMLWLRPNDADAALGPPGPLVVHGHTPGAAPVITDRRICLDTAAVATGVLTAGRFGPQGLLSLFATKPTEPS